MQKTIAGVILAGGAGTRIGGTKGLRPFGSATLVDAVIARVKDQVAPLALNVSQADLPAYRARYSNVFPLIADSLPAGTGPLAGIVAGLDWAASLDSTPQWLATFPCDTPFLPEDLVARLLAASRPGCPVAAEEGQRLHGVCALWPIACLGKLREGVQSGRLRSVFGALEDLNGTRCALGDSNAFLNVNTPDDLRRAEAIASIRG